MDRNAFINKLHTIFCEKNKGDKLYSKVWITEADFGGMYHSGKFLLHVKAEHHIEVCTQEIKNVIELLADKAPEELRLIMRVIVYNSEDYAHCDSERDLVYSIEEEASC